MSYECKISFKTIKESELFAFFKTLKETTLQRFESIAKENAFFCPAVRYPKGKASSSDNRLWVFKFFNHRYFYNPEENLLGVFGVPKCLEDIFDNTVFFQNSCDQNYDFEEWKGIPLFEQIAEYWKTCPNSLIAGKYENENGTRDGGFDAEIWCYGSLEKKYDYFRKAYAYEHIWLHYCQKYLFDENEVVYINLFGHYEEYKLDDFVDMCVKHAEARLAEAKRKE